MIILPRARNDIDRNAAWWAKHHSVEEAVQWSDSVYDQLESLREFPESYSLSFENNKFDIEIRDKPVGFGSRPRYRAVFIIKGHEVFVLTVQAAEQNRLDPEDVRFDVDTG